MNAGEMRSKFQNKLENEMKKLREWLGVCSPLTFCDNRNCHANQAGGINISFPEIECICNKAGLSNEDEVLSALRVALAHEYIHMAQFAESKGQGGSTIVTEIEADLGAGFWVGRKLQKDVVTTDSAMAFLAAIGQKFGPGATHPTADQRIAALSRGCAIQLWAAGISEPDCANDRRKELLNELPSIANCVYSNLFGNSRTIVRR